MIYVLILFLFINNVFGIFPIAASYTVPVIILCAWKGFSKPTIYKKIFLLILLGLVLNLCSSQFFRGQSPWDTIRAMPSYFGLLFYFYLKQKNIQLWRMEKILLALIYTLDILYISQYYLYTLYGLNFMHLDDWMLGDSEGGVRLRIVSSSLYLVVLWISELVCNTRKEISHSIFIGSFYYVIVWVQTVHCFFCCCCYLYVVEN